MNVKEIVYWQPHHFKINHSQTNLTNVQQTTVSFLQTTFIDQFTFIKLILQALFRPTLPPFNTCGTLVFCFLISQITMKSK